MGCTFAMIGDYLNDFNSLRFSGENSFCIQCVGEFYSCTAQLKWVLCEEKKKEDGVCSSIG